MGALLVCVCGSEVLKFRMLKCTLLVAQIQALSCRYVAMEDWVTAGDEEPLPCSLCPSSVVSKSPGFDHLLYCALTLQQIECLHGICAYSGLLQPELQGPRTLGQNLHVSGLNLEHLSRGLSWYSLEIRARREAGQP